MFLKVIFKGDRTKGEVVKHYRMVESYRYLDTVKHQNILHLGTLSELTEAEDIKLLGRRIDELVKQRVTGKATIFGSGNTFVEQLAQQFANQIIEKRKIDVDRGRNFELIDTDSISHKDVREIGAEWLFHQTLDQLGLKDFLAKRKYSEEDISLAYTHLIGRAVYPSSEYRSVRWIKQNSAVCELTQYPIEKITKDKLYGNSLKLYEDHEELEKFLSQKTNELFDIEDKIIIYDLTNTYFEGRMNQSEKAKFGRSKEKRTDAKLIVLALVVNEYGFVKYSKIFEGNKSDSSSLKDLLTELTHSTSYLERRPTVVMDAGIASEQNLKLLKDNAYNYMCVSRSGMSKYQVKENCKPIVVQDNKGQPIELQEVQVPESDDQFILVKSSAKELKEKSINEQFQKRFEIGLQQIKDSLSKKSGIKTLVKVAERIGRQKQKYPSISKYYSIEIVKKENEDKVEDLIWKMEKPITNQGHYLLRTNLDAKSEKVKWQIYNVIREIEATFRTLKTDLDLRPIYHKTDKASMAHLHLGILAYTAVNTIRQHLKRNQNSLSWKELVRIMNTQKLVTTQMEGPQGKIIKIKKCSEPTKEVETIYKQLNFKSKPFRQKKFVVPPDLHIQTMEHDNQHISSP
jgi:hypothetical protein